MTPRTALVAGAGAGGMTLALLLARSGRRVTLIDGQPDIGGYLRRFTREGVRFDTGYHFSGGFTGVMAQMMRVLGIDDRIAAEPIPNRIILRDGGDDLTLAAGCGHRGAEETPMHDLRDITAPEMALSRYDLLTVKDFCTSIGLSPAAMAAAGFFAMCHGTPPSEASMTFHGRVGYALCDDLARPVGGGDAMIEAFRREAERFGITIRTGISLRRFDEPDDTGACRRAHFSDGTDMETDEVFFTIHPLAVKELLPESVFTPSLQRRLRRLRETTSFFCSYYLADDEAGLTPGLISYFDQNDMDAILNGERSYSTGYMVNREPDAAGRMRTSIAAFRTMPPGTPEASPDRRERRGDARYQEWKARLSAEIGDELVKLHPALRGHLRPVAAGTPLTCRDYDPPTGSAYGTRCLCGQSRLCGRLPVRNFYIAGQSALVPGVMGTMLTSFTVFRLAAGEEAYRRIIRESGILD